MQIQTPSLTVDDVLIKDSQLSPSINDPINKQIAIGNLASTSNNEIATYIVDRLYPNEILSVNQQFDLIKKILKREYPEGLSRDVCELY